ncbi:hypothetical protein [Psychromonas sp. L1A2]|nr:hypothetical protein [Psychromonas sp. L1A2]
MNTPEIDNSVLENVGGSPNLENLTSIIDSAMKKPTLFYGLSAAVFYAE